VGVLDTAGRGMRHMLIEHAEQHPCREMSLKSSSKQHLNKENKEQTTSMKQEPIMTYK